MVQIVKVQFTAEELEMRSILEGEPEPFLQFYKSHRKVKVPGKIIYSKLIGQRITQLTPTLTKYAMHETFTISDDKQKGLGYVICAHKQRSPITYKTADFKLGNGLEFEVSIKCDSCFGIEKVIVVSPDSTVAPSSHPSSVVTTFSSVLASSSSLVAATPPSFYTGDINASGAIKHLYDETNVRINESLSRIAEMFSAESNADDKLRKCRKFAQYLEKFSLETGPASLQGDQVHVEEETAPGQALNPPQAVDKSKPANLFEKTKQAAKRKAEQADAIAKKKAQTQKGNE
jgi:hypothetical protein